MKRLLLLILAMALIPAPLMAVPAFARMTGNSCAYCHALPTLSLTAEGIKFMENGMRSAPVKFSAQDQTLDNYASLFIEYEMDAYRTTPSTAPSVQANQPVVGLVTGGPLSDHFSYRVHYHFNESADATENLEEAYLQYNVSPMPGMLLTVRGGQFRPVLLDHFGTGPTSFVEAPLVTDGTVTDATPYAVSNTMRGLDANLYLGSFQASLGVTMPTSNSIDANPTNHKDTYADVFYKIGDSASGVGLYRYDGLNNVYTTPGDPTTPLLYTDSYYRNGLLMRYGAEKFRLTGAVFEGAHTTDAFGTRIKNLGWYGLAEVNFNEHFGIFARYDKLTPDRNDPTLDTKMAVLGLNGFMFRTPKSGGRWVLEASQTTNAGITNHQALLDLIVAF